MTKGVLRAVLQNQFFDRIDIFGTLLDLLDEKLATEGKTAAKEAQELFTDAGSNSQRGFKYIKAILDVYGHQGPLGETDVLELSQYAAHW